MSPSPHYANPALDAELAYRREVLTASGHGTRNHKRTGSWLRNRKRTR